MDLRDSIWYFPGDPPVFEMVATFSLFVLAVLGIVWAIVLLATTRGRARRFRRKLSFAVLNLMAPCAIVLVAAGIGISRRHFGEWAGLKALIREYSSRVAAEIENGEDPNQLAALEMKLLTPAPTFKFRSLPEPVRLKVMQASPPYVGVDFGNGANAIFDPLTMICTYAD